MYLDRVTPGPWVDGTFAGQMADGYTVSSHGNETAVVASFLRYGGGTKRQSDYVVAVAWADVETILEKFCDANHPEAIALREARKLAAAVKGIGWQPPEAVK